MGRTCVHACVQNEQRFSMFVLGASLLPREASSDRTILQSVRGSTARGVAQEEAPERGRGSPERPEGRLAAGGEAGRGDMSNVLPPGRELYCLHTLQSTRPRVSAGPACFMRGYQEVQRLYQAGARSVHA